MTDPDTPQRETPVHADTHAHSDKEEPGLLADVRLLWRELAELRHVSFRLLGLEAQRAGISLVVMLIAGILIAILLSVVWLGLVAAAMLALKQYGVITDDMMLILLSVAINVVLVLVLGVVIRGRSFYLRFPATIRSLQPKQHEIPDSKEE